jgi:Mg2+ and Co2+ transporter CorA
MVMSPGAVRTRVWRNGIVEADDFPFEQISDYLEQPDCIVWADLCAPDDQQLSDLAEELGFDRHAVEDAASEHARPKATRYSTHIFLSTYAMAHDDRVEDLQSDLFDEDRSDTHTSYVPHCSAFGACCCRCAISSRR